MQATLDTAIGLSVVRERIAHVYLDPQQDVIDAMVEMVTAHGGVDDYDSVLLTDGTLEVWGSDDGETFRVYLHQQDEDARAAALTREAEHRLIDPSLADMEVIDV